MANQQEQQIDQILKGLLGSSAPAPAEKTMPDDELLRSLYEMMQGDSASGLNLDTPTADATLIEQLDQQFLDLCDTFLTLKSCLVASAHPETFIRLESYLAGAQAEITALIPEGALELPEKSPEIPMALMLEKEPELSEKSPEVPVVLSEPAITPKETSRKKGVKVWHVALGGAAICLPLVLKLSVPAILSNRRIEPFLPNASSAMDQVVSVQGSTLSVEKSGQAPQDITLAGIAPAGEHWQSEANGIISALLESTQGQVSVASIERSPSGEASALVELPSGTTIQQVLLEDGVAKLDDATLKLFPADVATKLQTAQSLAQAQHKNIWSEKGAQ